MTDTKTNEDLRDEIIESVNRVCSVNIDGPYRDFIKECMEEYLEKRVTLDLLPWMAKSNIQCFVDNDEERTSIFKKSRNYLTANELFQNFL